MKGFRLRMTPELEARIAQDKAQQRADLLAGKISVRWSQTSCGFRIWSGRSPVLGLETFMTESQAWAWLEERHGIKKD